MSMDMSMQMQQEPTLPPTPWEVSTGFQDANPDLKCSLLDAEGAVVVQHADRAVLSAIATAVNAHEALVEVAKLVQLAPLQHGTRIPNELMQAAQRALAAAQE